MTEAFPSHEWSVSGRSAFMARACRARHRLRDGAATATTQQARKAAFSTTLPLPYPSKTSPSHAAAVPQSSPQERRTMPFDLSLSYPQWQGSGRHVNLPRGAEAVAEVCGRFAPLVRVPLGDGDVDGETRHGVHRWEAIFTQFRSAQDILANSGARRVLTAGGDCAVDVAVIDYLKGVHPDLQVIWIDAHLDANTPATSPSGNFHGMPVSAILGRAPGPMRTLLGKPIDPARFHYVGIQVGDDGDWELQRELDLQRLDPNARIDGPAHIHFDLDALDPSEFPYVAYPDGKLRIDDAIALVSRIAREADLVGFTVTEFAPANDDEARAGSRVIERLCEAAVAPPPVI
ncbi:arginase family protein [Lysobacter panacisoli]|uniref:arginase family protein n=1 Tax=Lysobacter panacisoli TaxID=1255263 RepID=UPI001E59818A|nr:arginase family protein [Lysobacter panacisoli]